MKEFVTAAEQANAEPSEEQVYEFTVDGTECKAYRPSDGQLAVLMATNTRHSTTEEQIAGLINFFVAVLDDDSHSYIVNRLLNRKDPFGLEQVQGIFEWLLEEWSGRPTKSPSVSTRSRQTGGQKSTQPTQQLTSSDSQPIAS